MKTPVAVAVVVLTNVFGNFFLSLGLRQAGVLSPWVGLGVLLLTTWMLSRLALLSWADLSYVLPVTSFGYVLTALLGRLFLGEQVSPLRWAGTLLIAAGVVLVSRTGAFACPPKSPR